MYTIRCTAGHETAISDETELEEAVEFDSCEECGAEIEDIVEDGVDLECLHCGWSESCNFRDAVSWWWSGCPDCQANEVGMGALRVKGSKSYMLNVFARFQPEIDASEHQVVDRPDYWELVMHFCDRSAFLSILENQAIEASPTGLFNVNAVCLTDAPMPGWRHFMRRYGEYGFMFHKHDLLAAGGGPAIYLNDSVISAQKANGGFSAEISPFVNVYRIPKTAPKGVKARRVDWVHDREWRFPRDLAFNEVEPIGVIVPPDFEKKMFGDRDWQAHLAYLGKFPVLRA